MTAEIQAALLVKNHKKPLLPEGYYRSKLFIASSASNPLIGAAGPILSLLERLNISSSLPPVEHLRDNIQHELHAFHSRLIGMQYTEELIFIAHYLLSATIDELIGKNYIRLNGKPAEFQAFTPISMDEEDSDNKFFQILNEVKKRATQYLDLVELAYYCLIAGFEGEHHVRADGRQTLDNLIEELYQIIQQHRVHKPHRLFKQKPILKEEEKKYKAFVKIGLLGFAFILMSYFLSSVFLEYKAKSILNGHFLVTDTQINE